jgi:hypothetical protein
MEQIPKITRKQFLTVVGSALLAVVVAKLATMETTLTAATSSNISSKSLGYRTAPARPKRSRPAGVAAGRRAWDLTAGRAAATIRRGSRTSSKPLTEL